MARTINGFNKGYNSRCKIYKLNEYYMKNTYNNEELIEDVKPEIIYVKDYKDPTFYKQSENYRKTHRNDIMVISKDRLLSDDYSSYNDALMLYGGNEYRITNITASDTNEQKGFRAIRNLTKLIFTMVR